MHDRHLLWHLLLVLVIKTVALIYIHERYIEPQRIVVNEASVAAHIFQPHKEATDGSGSR